MVRVIVDFDVCEANGRCMDAAPEVFYLDENDELHILIPEPGEELRAKVERAVMACPKAAIRIED